MKKSAGLRALALLSAAALLGGAVCAFGADEAAGPGAALGKREAEVSQGDDEGELDLQVIRELKAAEGASQLIVVIGQGGAKVSVDYYRKGEDGDWEVGFQTEGVCGRNGMTYDKREGDGKTPCGTFGFNLAFGILDDPGSKMAYHKVAAEDYWVDDGDSRYYNKLVNAGQVKKDWNSAEKLIDIQPYYNYGFSLDYNIDCVPGKGSAIFLHCTTPEYPGSSGCICIPQDRMLELLKTVDEDTRIVIVPDRGRLSEQ